MDTKMVDWHSPLISWQFHTPLSLWRGKWCGIQHENSGAASRRIWWNYAFIRLYHRLQMWRQTSELQRYRFQAGVLNSQILNKVLKSQLFTSLWNRSNRSFLTSNSFRKALFQLLNPGFTPVFNLRKQIGVWNCHATRAHQKRSFSHAWSMGVWWSVEFSWKGCLNQKWRFHIVTGIHTYYVTSKWSATSH